MPQIHAARRARAREQITALGADAALITSPPNVRYLTGLTSSNAAVLAPADGPAVLGTDSRYAQTGTAPTLCRSKIGFWHVNCAISDVRRLVRIR
jgi:Xaa-Pro aminopeptidase